MMGHLSAMLKWQASGDYGQIIVTVNCPKHLDGDDRAASAISHTSAKQSRILQTTTILPSPAVAFCRQRQ